jgi:Tat protein translocase TatB subunit
MFDVGGGELLLIIIAIIVLFGPKKLPELAQMFGKGMRQVRKAQAQFQSQISELQSDLKTVIETPKEVISKNINEVKSDFENSVDKNNQNS